MIGWHTCEKGYCITVFDQYTLKVLHRWVQPGCPIHDKEMSHAN